MRYLSCDHDNRLTVLFSDLVGATELSTRLHPEEWHDRVAQYAIWRTPRRCGRRWAR